MSIPPLDPTTGYLPPGDHPATLDEIRERFGIGMRRRELMDALQDVVRQLESYGVTVVLVDGSFVSDKRRPSDVDVLYAPPAGGDPTTWGLLAPSRRDDLKRYRRIDLWPAPSPQPSRRSFGGSISLKEMWEYDRDGVHKGLLLIRRTP